MTIVSDTVSSPDQCDTMFPKHRHKHNHCDHDDADGESSSSSSSSSRFRSRSRRRAPASSSMRDNNSSDEPLVHHPVTCSVVGSDSKKTFTKASPRRWMKLGQNHGQMTSNSFFSVLYVSMSVGLFLFTLSTSSSALRRMNQSIRRQQARHPLNLSFRNRRHLRDNAASTSSSSSSTPSIRYLTMGGATTWGLGLEQPDQDAYPYLISSSSNNEESNKNVHNAAQRVGGPTLASLCTQSIIGDDHVYDVIVLEYSSSDHDFDALSLLMKRLRQRFPHAMLLLVQLWTPMDYFFYDDNSKNENGNRLTPVKVSFEEWRKQQEDHQTTKTFSLFALWNDDDFKEGTLQTLLKHQWIYHPPTVTTRTTAATTSNDSHETLLKELLDQVNGHLVCLPRPSEKQDEETNDQQLLLVQTMLENFVEVVTVNGDLQYSLSKQGHELLATVIQAKIQQHRDEITKSQQRDLLDPSTLLGSWGSGDSCQLWYETGEGLTSTAPTMSSNIRGLTLKAFSQSRDKYAMEVSFNGGASFNLHNPFDHDRMVYLTYMTTSAASSPNKIYPKVQVTINGKPTVILDPYHDDNSEDRHVTRTTAIGSIPPNQESTIQLSPMQETLAPFRIAGVSLLAVEKMTHSIETEFHLSPERAQVGQLYRNLDVW